MVNLGALLCPISYFSLPLSVCSAAYRNSAFRYLAASLTGTFGLTRLSVFFCSLSEPSGFGTYILSLTNTYKLVEGFGGSVNTSATISLVAFSVTVDWTTVVCRHRSHACSARLCIRLHTMRYLLESVSFPSSDVDALCYSLFTFATEALPVTR